MGFRSLAPVEVPLETNVVPWEGRKKVKGNWTAGLVEPLIKVNSAKVTQPSVSRRDFQAKSHSFVFVLQ